MSATQSASLEAADSRSPEKQQVVCMSSCNRPWWLCAVFNMTEWPACLLQTTSPAKAAELSLKSHIYKSSASVQRANRSPPKTRPVRKQQVLAGSCTVTSCNPNAVVLCPNKSDQPDIAAWCWHTNLRWHKLDCNKGIL